jgi:cobalt-zinc-cadmium efflux system outer membrane protein
MVFFAFLLLAQAQTQSEVHSQAATDAPVALTLAEAVRLARAHSPLAKAARVQADGAARAARAAGRLADPTLDLRMENWRPGASDFVASTDADVFMVATQPLDLFTRGGRKAQAQGESVEADAQRFRTEQDVVIETVRRYAEAARGRDLVGALENQSAKLDEIVVAMEKRVRDGRAAEADLLRFRAEAARAANHLARTRIEAEVARAELALLVGRSVGREELELPPVPPSPSGDATKLAEVALARRPDVLASEARAVRAAGTLTLERGRRWPALALVGGYKRTAGLDTAVVGVLATVPLFDRNGRALARAEGDARAAALEKWATVERARAEAAILVRAARSLAERAARVDAELVRPAEEALHSALSAFNEGAVDVLRVVDAERTHADACREALDITVEAFVTTCRARLAAGLEPLP